METFAPKGKIFGPILPQFILEKRITLGAKVMYALLCNYASEKDHCWPSHATLASRLSCSISSVKNYLAELVRENLIAIRKEHYRSSVYYLICPEHNNNADESNSKRSERIFACNKSSSGYINNFNKQKQEKNTPLPPKSTERTPQHTALSAPSAGCGISSEQDFENVWNLYPRKEAKGFARLAWFRLARCGQLPPVSELHAALQHCMAQESWHREQGRFIPQLGNWLRGQRWLDALSSGSPSGRRPDPGVQKAMQEREEQEKRILERQKAEKERLRPLFRAFAEKFDAPFNEAMAFGIWLHLHSIHSAPAAEDVPADNTRSMVAFLLEYRRKVQERRYTSPSSKADTPISYFHRPELLFGRNSESPAIPTYA